MCKKIFLSFSHSNANKVIKTSGKEDGAYNQVNETIYISTITQSSRTPLRPTSHSCDTIEQSPKIKFNLIYSGRIQVSMTTFNVSIISHQNDEYLVSRKNADQVMLLKSYTSFFYTPQSTECKVNEAILTPSGDILYTCPSEIINVVLMRRNSYLKHQHRMIDPKRFSVSIDKKIYLADGKNGVFESIDNGLSWTFVFTCTESNSCVQVIKVSANNIHKFWTLVLMKEQFNLRIGQQNLNNDDFKWHDVVIPSTIVAQNSNLINLAFDGVSSMLLSDGEGRSVHVISTNGEYYCQLLSASQIMKPLGLLLNYSKKLLIVLQDNDMISVFDNADIDF